MNVFATQNKMIIYNVRYYTKNIDITKEGLFNPNGSLAI